MNEPHFSVEKKMEIVILSLAPNANDDGICGRFGIHKSTLREWKTRFLDGARAALGKQSRDTTEIKKKLEDSRKALKDLITKDGPKE